MSEEFQQLLYWYIPFIPLPFIVGYILNKVVTNDYSFNRVGIVSTIIFCIIPIFNITATIVYTILLVAEYKPSKKSKIKQTITRLDNWYQSKGQTK